MVDNAPVNLFWHPEIKTTVARLHMENRNLAALCGNSCQGTIGVTQKQQCFRLMYLKSLVDCNNDLADCLGCRIAGSRQKHIWLAYIQVAKKYFIQLVIEVLPGVHQHMITVIVQLGDGAG